MRLPPPLIAGARTAAVTGHAPGRRALGLGLAALVVAATMTGESRGQWPPPESASAAEVASPSFWPNDPDYGFSAEADGQWPLYSFLPSSDGARVPGPGETSAGARVDLAWRYSIGDDRVIIAVIGPGLCWDEPELVERIALNLGELGSHKPLLADGTACGGADEQAGFDCNGDGRVTVADWAQTPWLQPTDGDPSPGDLNGNGLLDAGDLGALFADGIDDDANGYLDDISGWDFEQEDADAADETADGQATRTALVALAEGNNAMGTIGACPRCRLLPIRVSMMAAAEPNAVAKAIAYATDRKAGIVLAPSLTLGGSAFLQEAIDYAWQNETLVVVGGGDEHATHASPLAAANHLLSVHGLTFAPAGRVADAETFLDLNACGNHGPQLPLVAPAKACSDSAAALVAGIAGLLLAHERDIELSPRLTTGELRQLLLANAEDIELPEALADGTPLPPTQPGFDAHVGHGRVDANRTVESLRAGRIPPTAEISSPRWFTAFYPARLTAAVPIHAIVSAARATSYDYAIDWAPGVSPAEEDFVTLESHSALAPSVVSGSNGPLLELDLRTLPLTTAPSAGDQSTDSLRLTIRVRATAHYGAPTGDVTGEDRRVIVLQRDPELVAGFPFELPDGLQSGPQLVDLNGDGASEIICATAGGSLVVLRQGAQGPKAVDGFPVRMPVVDGLQPTAEPDTPSHLGAPAYLERAIDPDLARSALLSTPAVGDLDGDGSLDIVVASIDGRIIAVTAHGELRDGWPVRLPAVAPCGTDTGSSSTNCMAPTRLLARGALAAPVLADLDGDDTLEVIVAALDGMVYAWRFDGSALDGWPVGLRYGAPVGARSSPRAGFVAAPAVGDVNGDGVLDVVVSSSERLGPSGDLGALFAIAGRGTEAVGTPSLLGWPVTVPSLDLFAPNARGLGASPALGMFEDAVVVATQGNGGVPWLLPPRPGEQPVLSVPPANLLPPSRPDPSNPGGSLPAGLAPAERFGPLSLAPAGVKFAALLSHPVLADVDQDGVVDVVSVGSDLQHALELRSRSSHSGSEPVHLLAVWSGATGQMLPGSPYPLTGHVIDAGAAVADLDGDDYPEVVVGTTTGGVHAVNGCGAAPPGWPKELGQWVAGAPALGDLDGDGLLEVVVATRSGRLFAWHTAGRADGVVGWPAEHHDAGNRRDLSAPLQVGDPLRRAPLPLSVSICQPPVPQPIVLTPAGGCTACAVGAAAGARDDPNLAGEWGALLLLAQGLRGRRRRVTSTGQGGADRPRAARNRGRRRCVG